MNKTVYDIKEYTEEEFNEYTMEFNKMMGSKKFWELNEVMRDNAHKAYCYVYLHTTSISDRVLVTFDATIKNYEMRRNILNSIDID